MSNAPAPPTGSLIIGLTWAMDTKGRVIAEMQTSPTGDILMVGGIDLLFQEITAFIINRVGANPLNPTWGDAAFRYMGRPALSTPDDIVFDITAHVQDYFTQKQAAAAAAGTLQTASALDHIEASQAITDPSKPGMIGVSFIVYTLAGAQRTYILPFSLQLS